MLGNIGPLEIGIILIVALLVFGPKRLPELGNSLGKGIREFKGSVTGEEEDDEADDDVKAVAASQASAVPVEPVMSRPVEVDAVELADDNDRAVDRRPDQS